jgi:transcriptional regulator with GAF, ATPase, and Fis domain
MRVGGEREIKVDIRVIAATNKVLESMVREGFFRKDLYYRLKVMVVEMPPLRDRLEDILLLSNLFIEENNKEYNKNVKAFSEEAKKLMVQYSWPGNVRELEHLIERSVLLSTGQVLNDIHLPSNKKSVSSPIVGEKFTVSTLDENERLHILNTLKSTNGRIAGEGGAAELLGVPTSTLNSKMKRLGIRKEHTDRSGS